MSLLRTVSMMFLLLAIAVVAYLALSQRPLPFVATFSIQAAAILLLWVQLRRLRGQKGIKWIQSIPAGLRFALPMIAAAGVCLTVLEIASLLSDNTPSGGAVSSVNWHRAGSTCRVTYGGEVQVIRPLAACAELDQTIGLAFGGGWILVSAIALRLAFLRPGPVLNDGQTDNSLG